MKLVYLWLENYLGFKNQNINLGGCHKFEFNHETMTLKAIKNNGYIDELSFYSIKPNDNKNISCISCIVGENGSGKSSLLKIIKEYVAQKTFSNYIENSYLAIWTDNCLTTANSKINYYFDYHEKIGPKPTATKTKTEIILSSDSDEITPNEFSPKNNYVIIYSNYVDESINNEPLSDCQNFKDISTSSLLADIVNNNLNDKDNQRNPLDIYKSQEIKNKLDFFYRICNKSKTVKNVINSHFGFNAFSRKVMSIKPVIFNFNNNEKQYEDYFSKKYSGDFFIKIKDINDKVEAKINCLREKLPPFFTKYDIGLAKAYFCWLIAHNYWIIMLNYFTQKGNENVYYHNADSFQNFLDNIENKNTKPEDLIEATKKGLFCVKPDLKAKEYLRPKTVNKFIQLLHTLIDFKSDDLNYNQQNGFTFNIEKDHVIAKKIISLYAESLFPLNQSNYLGFSWFPTLSSGESSLLTLLSRLNNTFTEISMPQDVFLLLDEADVGFHPQWQKNFIAALINYLNIINNKNIQIIFTTNNPMPLSDILPYNTVFLKNEPDNSGHTVQKKENACFASDLLTLYSDSFFIQDGLIGEFANKKLSEIIKYSKNLDKEDNKKDFYIYQDFYETITEQIGDTYLKQHIKALLERKKRYFND